MENLARIIAFFLLLTPSCSLLDGNPLPGRSRASTENGNRPPGPSGKRTYVSTVEYPDGYDWVRDTAYGTVNFTIGLYADGEKILSLSSENNKGLSPDPDMHRIARGSLYTDFCSDGETIILKDGEPFLRYKGEESLEGFIFSGEKLHTLGKNRSGKGFSYRINGENIFSSFSGEIVGGLHADGSDICFAFRIGSAAASEYFLVRNGSLEEVPRPSDNQKIVDIRSLDGNVATLGIVMGSVFRFSRKFLTGVNTFGGAHPVGYVPSAGKIIGLADGTPWVTGYYDSPEHERLHYLWCPGIKAADIWLENGMNVVSSCISGGSVFLAGNDTQTGKPFIYAAPDGEKTVLDNGKLLFPYCCFAGDGELLAAFSVPGTSINYIWENGDLAEMAFNGYISGIRRE